MLVHDFIIFCKFNDFYKDKGLFFYFYFFLFFFFFSNLFYMTTSFEMRVMAPNVLRTPPLFWVSVPGCRARNNY